MELDAIRIAQNVLREPLYRGHNLKYKLRWSIGNYLCQLPVYVEEYFDIPIHEHVAFIDKIEKCIREGWQRKAKKTRLKTKQQITQKKAEENQSSFQF